MTTSPPDGPAAAVATPLPPETGPFERIERFTVAARLLHWSTAVLVLVLVATASALYLGPISTLVGRRDLMKTVHVLAGLALPVPLLLAYAGSWRVGVRREVRQLARAVPDTPKYSGGQRLFAAYTLGMIVVMLGTGVILRWPDPWPLEHRTGATFVHDWLALTTGVTVVGHVALALQDPDRLRGMWRGWVTRGWLDRQGAAPPDRPDPPGAGSR